MQQDFNSTAPSDKSETGLPSKVLFLDFDGPLSTYRVALQTGTICMDFDPVTIGVLNNICEVSGAKIVCTSTRAGQTTENFKTVCGYFEKAGLDLNNLHSDWSCVGSMRSPRKTHITDWLKLHPEVKQYVIIDDDPVDLPNFVSVDGMDGLLISHFRAIAGYIDCDLGQVFEYAQAKPELARPTLRADL